MSRSRLPDPPKCEAPRRSGEQPATGARLMLGRRVHRDQHADEVLRVRRVAQCPENRDDTCDDDSKAKRSTQLEAPDQMVASAWRTTSEDALRAGTALATSEMVTTRPSQMAAPGSETMKGRGMPNIDEPSRPMP